MLFLGNSPLISNIARLNIYWIVGNKQENLLLRRGRNRAYLARLKPIESYNQADMGDCRSKTKFKIAEKTK